MQMEGNALAKLEAKESGYARYECALHSSAWTVAMGLGTYGAMTNSGLYSWDVLKNAYGPGSPKFFELPRWDPADDGLTTEDVTKIVKKAGKFYGASLVGIAPVDERWFYSHVMDMNPFELLEGLDEIAADMGIELPESSSGISPRILVQNAMLSMEKGEMKDLIIRAAERVDESALPEGLTIGTIKTMPAGMFQSMLPTVIKAFSNEFMYAMAVEVPSELLPADFDAQAILEEEIEVLDMSAAIPGAEVVFYDGDKNYFDNSQGAGKGKYYISRKMKYVIVLAYEEDEDGIMTEHGMIPEAAVGMGYSRMAFTAGSVAQFLRDLGYNAIPMGNDTSLSVPIAIDAGLGELSRMGYMITPKYGPRVRISKVLTDLPLIPDQPISFGVTEFCEICGKCAKECPSGAISTGERSYEAVPPGGNPGVYKWAVDGVKCQQQWGASGVSCSICKGVCPFNKPDGWLHDATRILIGAKSGSIDNILLKLDDASGFGKKMTPEEFWARDKYLHIKS
jgi:reductive dehalogenase